MTAPWDVGASAQPFLDALGKEFNFEPPQKPGYDTVETLHAMFDGDIKVFFAISGNFLSNVPDTVYSSHAMQRCKLTAHVSTKLNRSHLITGERAMMLPCFGRSEEDIQASGKQFLTVEDSMGIINPSQGFLRPASPQLMSDVAILANLAHTTWGLVPVQVKKALRDFLCVWVRFLAEVWFVLIGMERACYRGEGLSP